MGVLAAALTAFLLADTWTLSVAGDTALGPSIGILLGIVAAALAGFFVLPRARNVRLPGTLTITPSAGGSDASIGLTGPGQLVRDRYRLVRLLGEGAQGMAYLARDELLARDVVLKAVRSDDVKR